MKKNLNIKIFNNNLNNNPKTVALRKKIGDIGKTKYLPSFSKEWKNTIYGYNKNMLKNIPANDVNINKIIQSYFNLYFKDHKYIGSRKFILLRRRRTFLRKIYVSNAEIKHTNNKAIITLFTVNREKKILKRKYLKINKKISQNLIRRYFLLYNNNVSKIYDIINKHKDGYNFLSIDGGYKITKKGFLKYRLKYLNKFIKLKHLYLRKIWSVIISKYWRTHLKFLRKYDLMYSLNQYKFNKLTFLPKLSNILNKIIGKKIEYNIINLKSIAYNTDLFTNALALKLKKKKMNYIKSMFSILNRAYLPKINTIKERTLVKGQKNIDLYLDKYKDLNIISNLNNINLDKLLNEIHNTTYTDKISDKKFTVGLPTTAAAVKAKAKANNKKIHNLIYNSIGYKNMGGIRLEVKGRLTKRYRADRSIYSLKWKGGLKNVDSSFKRLSSVLFRGNSKSNMTYTLSKSKRRIGAFAVKGWISGK
uniref:Ribosomal protein S3 n=1 Tax=Trichoderma cornu-damae TaxID=654480 RepID=A0A8E6Z9F0_9HYPO|nr:ribosomal protein S3 [Trichoderma cornu-damae]